MILYGAPISPYVRKVLVFAAEKGLELELVPTGIADPNPDFAACSPFRKMPGFSDGDFRISDSSAIVTYLEAKHPEPSLLPAAPEDRARAIWFDEFADTIMGAANGKLFFNRIVAPKFMGREGDEAVAEQGQAELLPVFAYLDEVLPASGFLVADRLTLADIAVGSMFANLSHLELLPDPETYPGLAAYVEAMHARPSFATWLRRERKMLGLG